LSKKPLKQREKDKCYQFIRLLSIGFISKAKGGSKGN
jgi:hypothetical protein